MDNPDGSNNAFYIPGDSVIEVNRYGKRVMDEKRNYTDRTMHHFEWDSLRAEWTNMLLFLIYDQRTASLWGGMPPYPVPGSNAPYVITSPTLRGLAPLIEARLEKYRAKTGGFTLSDSFADGLAASVSRFNKFAKEGKDKLFNRGENCYDQEWTSFPPTSPNKDTHWPPRDSKNITMYPMDESGPFYAVILSAGTLDTNGGPVTNANAQVLDGQGNIIQGLYGAGNCVASPSANAYWGAGATIGSGMTFGHLAGKHISSKKAE